MIINHNQYIILKTSSRRRYIFIIIIILLIITALFYIFFTQKSAYDPASEKIIREAAAKRLNKDPNDMTDEDFAKIKVLHFAEIKNYPGSIPVSGFAIVFKNKELTEISMIEKFTNLRKLSLANIRYKIPKWMKFMAEFGIIDLEDRFDIDLSPIANLSYLEVLDLKDSQIKSIKPLSNLTNLRMLDISRTQVSDIEPLKNLTNLEQVLMIGCKNITDKQVEDLKKAFPKLKVEYIKTMPQNTPYVSNSRNISMFNFKDYLPEVEIIDPNERLNENEFPDFIP